MSVQDLQVLVDAAVKEEGDLVAKQGELGTAVAARDTAKAEYDAKQAAVQTVTGETNTEKAELIAALRALADAASAKADQLGGAN